MVELEIRPTAAMRFRIWLVILVAAGLTAQLIYLLLGGSGDIFVRRTILTSYMPDGTGLATGSEVRLNGIRIGEATRVDLSGSLDPQRVVRAQMRVRARFLRNIPIDSTTDISSDTLVGYGYIEIQPGKSPVPIAENGILQSEPLKQAVNRADLIRALQDDLKQFDQILIQISSGQTQIGKFIIGETEYDEVLARIQGFDQSLHTFLTPRSQLGQAFYSLEAYDKIRGPVLRLNDQLASIQRGEGAAGRLYASDEQYNNLVRALSDLRSLLAELNDGRGKIGPFLHDDENWRRLSKLLASTNQLIASLNSGGGQAGRLLVSPELYDSLNGSLQKLEEVLREFREHPKRYLRFKP
jgi:phospholipid/cholesterol/gamma-HCH transport system substrate-binding protein